MSAGLMGGIGTGTDGSGGTGNGKQHGGSRGSGGR
jgi:hypothetical protein